MQLEAVGSNTLMKGSNDNLGNNMGIDVKKINFQKEKTQNQNMKVKQSEKVKENPYSEDRVLEIVDEANKAFTPYDRRFEISVHEKTKKIMIKVLDSVTDQVIKELPPEKILDVVAGLWEVAGIIVDKKI